MVPEDLSKSSGEYRIELIRKAIHLCSLSIPVAYFFYPRATALSIIIPVTLACIAVDIMRHYVKPVQDQFYRIFGWLLRPSESDLLKKRLNGATYVLISATLCILFFPKIIAITCFSILIISDLTAALVGKRFGRHPLFRKSIEGSLAFFLSAVIVVILTPKIEYRAGEYIIGSVAALAGTIAEVLPTGIDDNLSVPLSAGITLWLLYSLVMPMVDIYKFG